MIKLLVYYKEAIPLKLALFFLSLSYLSKLDKYDIKHPTNVQTWYASWVDFYLSNFKDLLDKDEK